jgi:hypothetical protein
MIMGADLVLDKLKPGISFAIAWPNELPGSDMGLKTA